MTLSSLEFDRLAALGRKRIIAVYAYQSQEKDIMTPTQSAAQLTYRASSLNPGRERAPIPSTTLASWSNPQSSFKVPYWAVESALDLLLEEYQWAPNGEVQWAVVADVLYRKSQSIDEAMVCLPEHLRKYEDRFRQYVMAAHQSRQLFLSQRKRS